MLQRELDVAIAAARAAGSVIRDAFETPCTVHDKGAGDPVTAVDIAANAAIHRLVTAAFPADAWFSEETSDSGHRLAQPRVWIVDPLDGTKEFIDHVPEFAVCVALVEGGEPVVGVSYEPIGDRLYAARRGGGTTCNGSRVRVSAGTELATARVLASRSEDARGEWAPFRAHCQVLLTGSVALKLARVAAGEADATFTLTPKNEWDICAGTLLIREAGGVITDRDGHPLRFNEPDPLRPGLIAANALLHRQLRELIARVETDRV